MSAIATRSASSQVSIVSLSSSRTKLLIIITIVLCAGIVRLLTFDRYYPVNDYGDEPIYLALANDARGLSDQSALRHEYGTLAPFYVAFSQVVQTIYDRFKTSPWDIPGEYLYVMRALSALFGVLTALIISWLAWQLAGQSAALVAGLLWALSPVVVDFNSLALPDPLLYLLCALAVTSALFAWRRQSLSMLIVSFLCGVAAIYTKLWVATALLPFVIATALLVKLDRRRWLKSVILLYVIGVGFAAHFLLVINPFSSTNKIKNNISDGNFFANLANVPRLINNFWHMLLPIDQGMGIAIIILIIGIAAYIYNRRQKITSMKLGDVLFVGAYTLATWWLSAGISNVSYDTAGRMRHIFPAVVVFLSLWSALLVQIGFALRHWFAKLKYQIPQLPAAVIALTLLLILPGFVSADAQKIAAFQRDHENTRILAWFDKSPPHDGIVLSPAQSTLETLWNRFWGMYIGSKPYNQWFEPLDKIIQTPPASYLQRDISWLVLDDADIERLNNPTVVQDYLSHLFRVKTISANPPEAQGRTAYVYRFAPPNQTTDFTFGDTLKLIGYDLSASSFKAGDSFSFRPYWQLMNPTTKNLSLFFHLYTTQAVDSGEFKILAQFDTTPMHNADSPTSTWQDTGEVYMGDSFVFTIPEGLPSGDYVLALGLYDYLSGERLKGSDGTTYYRMNVHLS